ncbi:glycoside hydrolase family 75 protein [Streptomyces yaizuensis]|uniref:Glycoside hydrolase family 75 protein n=1 Tax=Streptomyces yaizuensis TaxID=2989713 RepID=A0ABQ5P620_9ACTN|nr:glycoside hydrolase family 75 protein [Streptomyces sp. YSPA8]GLF98002.1 glycoside hydrolase family 75 protein [Streptomyces sp. YSPA8]
MLAHALALSTALGVTLLPAVAQPTPAGPDRRIAVPGPQRAGAGAGAGAVTAAELLAGVAACERISTGLYPTDARAPATVPVCDTGDAVFWKADLDVDCDGQPTARCNTRTDPYFLPHTAFRQSDGRPLNAETLPFVVVPAPSGLWRFPEWGIGGGSVVAVVHGDTVRYGVVGDTGPAGIIGEASHAMAVELGIDPDPRTGGVTSGVTYIVFKGARVAPVESRAAAVARGEELSRGFLAAHRIRT